MEESHFSKVMLFIPKIRNWKRYPKTCIPTCQNSKGTRWERLNLKILAMQLLRAWTLTLANIEYSFLHLHWERNKSPIFVLKHKKCPNKTVRRLNKANWTEWQKTNPSRPHPKLLIYTKVNPYQDRYLEVKSLKESLIGVLMWIGNFMLKACAITATTLMGGQP